MIGLLSIGLLLVSAVRALIITSPAQGASITKGQSFSLLVNLQGGETATQATVYFNDGTTVSPVAVTVGTAQNVVLPLSMKGTVTLTAVATNGSGATATSSINLINPQPYPYYPCYNPCYRPYNPCYRPYNPCYRPKPVCNIPRPVCNIPRPRENRCRIRVEEPSSFESSDSFESSNPQILYSGFSILVADDAQDEHYLQEIDQQDQIDAELEHQMVAQAIKELEQQEQLEKENEKQQA